MRLGQNLLQQGAGVGGGLSVSDTFSTDLYTGNGSTQTITNGIDLSGEGGLVWLKVRNASGSNFLRDTARGGNKLLITDSTGAEQTTDSYPVGNGLQFNADGFSLGPGGAQNASGFTFASWTFRKAPAFFDVVTYTGNGINGRSIPHNLGVEPGMIVVKRIDGVRDWHVYHRSTGLGSYLILNSTSGAQDNTNFWTSHTSDTFGVKVNTNDNGFAYVAYLFAHDETPEGTIRCGSYTGNGSATGPVISLGWEPQWLLVKSASSPGAWVLYDNERSLSNPRDRYLLANSPQAETQLASLGVDFISTGFQPRGSDGSINQNGVSYIYMAIRAEGA